MKNLLLWQLFSGLLLVTTISDCSNGPSNENSSYRIINIDYRDKAIETAPNYKHIRFIPLETTKEALIGRIDKLVVSENRFYILDLSMAEAIFIYNKNGGLVNSIKAKGKGPGEYHFVTDIGFDQYNKELIVVDPELNKILKYDQDGNYISEQFFKFTPSHIAVIDKNTYAFRTMTPDRVPVVKTTDHNGKKDTNIHTLVFELNMNYSYYFPKSLENQFYFELYKDTVWKIEKEKAMPYYVINYAGRNMSENDFKNLRDNAIKYRSIPKFPSTKSGDLRRFMETENYIQFFYLNLGDPSLVLIDKNTNQSINQIGFSKLKDDPLCAVFFSPFCSDDSDKFVGYMGANFYLEIMENSHVNELLSNGQVSVEIQGFKNQNSITIDSNPIITVLEL
jgi:hypothetical protein